MPIKIPDHLPARAALEREGLFVMGERDAIRQDIRPLSIGLLNLMPEKQKTEIQLARLIGATPLQIELTLVTTGTYRAKTVSSQHLQAFYHPWCDVRDQKFDGFIVTGAPVENLPFEDVKYWSELTEIFDWTRTHVHRGLNICWGAQAALYHFYKIPKYQLAKKMFGLYPHRVLKTDTPLLRGFSDEIRIPVSRYSETRLEDISTIPTLAPLIVSEQSGLCMVQDKDHRHVYMLNHLEYDATTLADEYHRDQKAGLDTDIPYGYFPGNDPASSPPNVWRSHAHLFVANWINEVYQSVPFDMKEIGDHPSK